MRRLAGVLAPALLAGALGCREGDQSPTAPGGEPVVAAAVASQPLSFRQLDPGWSHTCGVTTGSLAYCWGDSYYGRLGDGKIGWLTNSSRPVAVAGGLRFLHVSAGYSHTCGLATDSRAYCWGNNEEGQLGDGTLTNRPTPVAVAGGRRFRQVNAGYRHTCALSPSDVAFCWGNNLEGQLGDGTKTDRLTPVQVRGGLRFRRIIAGASHTCGATKSDRGYCWGHNGRGQLGDGTATARLQPVAVLGGISFRQVLAGSGHTCGVDRDNRAFCWGDNRHNNLGDGSYVDRSLIPVAVAGGLRFQGVTPGGRHTCGGNHRRRRVLLGLAFRGPAG